MRFLARILTLLVSLTGLATFSQAPEFAQQYRQRLGGAVEELRVIVADFDADAGRSSMTRDEALSEMREAETPFVRDRGTSMTSTINRFTVLESQLGAIDNAPDLTRPLLVATAPDMQIAGDAWEAFEPALPLTLAGVIWGGAGFAAGLVAMWLTRKGARRLRGNRGGSIRIGTAASAEIPPGIVIGDAQVTDGTHDEPHDGGLDGDKRDGIATMAVRPGRDP
ncbi:MAG: DUF2937 family protein [Nitratireductor sp.]|nr:DUF2937 family protein [Nitratireductor sp.]